MRCKNCNKVAIEISDLCIDCEARRMLKEMGF